MKVFICLLATLLACVIASPIEHEPIAPFFDAQRDVRFLLNTRANMGIPQELIWNDLPSLRNSNYNISKPTRFLIHGFQEDDQADINVETSRELLEFYDFNVIFVDWSLGSSTINYVAARSRINFVGPLVARYLDFLHENGALDFNRLTLIGFSLGAHIAGLTGKNVRRGRINTIIGLDPAGPLFDANNPSTRLAITDADYVECHHTNGGFIGAGIGTSIGHADFFVNGGSSQPGCLTNTCSHLRAVPYYVESIQNNQFWAYSCANENDAGRGRCTGFPYGFMGGEPSNRGNRGIYWLATNRRSPFGQGTLI